MKKLIVIPAYNEKLNIDAVVDDVTRHAPSFDYLIINDCSTDDTSVYCRAQGYHILDLPVNLGIGGGVQAGYLYAQRHGYDVVVQFDGDGQHDARYLNEMFDVMNAYQADMVIGSRYLTNEGFQSTFMRRFGIRILSGLIYLLYRRRMTDVTSGLRMINARTLALFCRYYPSDYPEPESVAICLRNGYKVLDHAVQMRPRAGGRSSISGMKSAYYMSKVSLAIVMDALHKRGG